MLLIGTDAGIYRWISLTDATLLEARRLVERHAAGGLRALDAIQLAAALTVREDVGLFLTAD